MNGDNKQRFDQAISRLQHALDDTDSIREVVIEYLQEIEQPIKAKAQELEQLGLQIVQKRAVLNDLDQQIKERQSELEWSGTKQEYVIRQLRSAIQTILVKPFRRHLCRDHNRYARQIQAAITRVVNHRVDDLLAISRVRSSNGQIEEYSHLAKECRQKLANELRTARKRLRELKTIESRHPNSFASVPPPLLDTEQIPNKSGVYFIWEGLRVAYVGQSINLAQRLLNHPRLEPQDKISYLCIDPNELFYHEAFYIGLCRPWRNGHQNSIRKVSSLSPLSQLGERLSR